MEILIKIGNIYFSTNKNIVIKENIYFVFNTNILNKLQINLSLDFKEIYYSSAKIFWKKNSNLSIYHDGTYRQFGEPKKFRLLCYTFWLTRKDLIQMIILKHQFPFIRLISMKILIIEQISFFILLWTFWFINRE